MMEIPFMDEVLSEEGKLMKWVGIFREGGGFFSEERSLIGGVGGGGFRRIFLEPILISKLRESVIMTNRLNLV